MKERDVIQRVRGKVLKIFEECLWLKIPDTIRSPSIRFSPVKYIDVILILREKIIGIEFKVNKNKKYMNVFSMLREIQAKTLEKINELGHESLVCVGCPTIDKFYLIPYTKVKNENIAFEELSEYIIKDGRKWDIYKMKELLLS